MAYTVVYNGKSSSSLTLNGKSFLHPASRPEISAPVEDITEYRVAGRDTPLTIHEGTFSPITITVRFSFKVGRDDLPTCLGQVYGWLCPEPSSNVLSFSYMLEKYYRVISVAVDPPVMESLSIGTITATFTCEPFPYDYTFEVEAQFNQYVQLPSTPGLLYHPTFEITNGSAGAYKIVRSTTGSNATGVLVMVVTLTGTSVTIDSDKMIAWRLQDGKKLNQSLYIDGDYKNLWVGPSTRNWFKITLAEGSTASTDATLVITPNRRVW